MNGIWIIALIVVGYLIYVTYGKQLLAEGRKGQIKIAVIVLGLVILAAVATGRASAIMAPIGAMMALITRFGRFAPTLFRYFPQLKSMFGDPARRRNWEFFPRPFSSADGHAGDVVRSRNRGHEWQHQARAV